MILTVGGDATSKGAQEIMHALAAIQNELAGWKYVCKVWPQKRTNIQTKADLRLAKQLGIEQNVHFVTNITSRNFMPYLIGACDIYAAPSRLEDSVCPKSRQALAANRSSVFERWGCLIL